MPLDAVAELATSLVAVAPSPPVSGTTLTLTTGEGTSFPSVGSFDVVIAPAAALPTRANAEICRATRAGDVLTLTRAQNGTTARTVLVGDRVYQGITAGYLTQLGVLALSTTISPATLTANADDYNPAGLANANIIKISGDASFRQILGLAGGVDGREVTFHNTASNALLLRDQWSTTAAMRFDFDGQDLPLWPGQETTVRYDGTAARWRVNGNIGGLLTPPPQHGTWSADDMHSSATSKDWSTAVAGAGATVADLSVIDGHPGVTQLGTGTTATGSSQWRRGSGAAFLALMSATQPGHYRCEVDLRVPVLSVTGTAQFVVRAGLTGLSAVVDAASGLYWLYDASVSPNWILRSRGSTNIQLTTGIAVTANTWYRLVSVITPDRSGYGSVSIAGGAPAVSNTGSLVGVVGGAVGAGVGIASVAGVATKLVDVDAISCSVYTPRRRA